MFTSPYLRCEARFIALTGALRHLTVAALANAAARAGAYVVAGLGDCTLDEDAEAQRRQHLYWRHTKPKSAAGIRQIAIAGVRRDLAAIDQAPVAP